MQWVNEIRPRTTEFRIEERVSTPTASSFLVWGNGPAEYTWAMLLDWALRHDPHVVMFSTADLYPKEDACILNIKTNGKSTPLDSFRRALQVSTTRYIAKANELHQRQRE